ncbi:MAG: PIN domain-containing protein [Pseudomonadota bacterium]|nr:PIN domain-containing protein [Gammaproteobacteria bacterium]MDQ3580863.1 PIN domain-containing protein [Pseudomonadota bacterium]
MNDPEAFHDTNIVLYLLSSDPVKADCAEALLAAGGRISVQVLNEFVAVATRKFGMSWSEIGEILSIVRAVCRVEPLTVETHDRARLIAERYRFGFYDALIVATALLSGCTVLYSEDLQAGQKIDSQLTVVNPFQL